MENAFQGLLPYRVDSWNGGDKFELYGQAEKHAAHRFFLGNGDTDMRYSTPFCCDKGKLRCFCLLLKAKLDVLLQIAFFATTTIDIEVLILPF